jgi:hypothetical protein
VDRRARVALAEEGVSVLRVDLASGRTESPGLVEVVREGRKIASVVQFEEDLLLARMGAGQDLAGALNVLPELPDPAAAGPRRAAGLPAHRREP